MRIVLLPGLDGTGRLFKRFLAAAPPHLSLTVLSLPEETSTYEDLAVSVTGNLPDGEPLVLIAESFSGPLAVALAERRPIEGLLRPAQVRDLRDSHAAGAFYLIPDHARSRLPSRIASRLLGASDKVVPDGVASSTVLRRRRARGLDGRRDAERAAARRSRKLRRAIGRGDFRPCDPRTF